MIPTVQKTIAARCPRMRGRRILVAVSGGADSVALAHVLHHLGYSLAFAHLNHGIRGRAADGDARFVANLAQKLGVPFYCAKEDVPAAAKASGESLEMAARRLRRLVKNLLDVSRLESGALKPRLDWCDLGDVIEGALAATREARRDHPVSVALPPDYPLVKADFSLMEQVLVNLLLNA